MRTGKLVRDRIPEIIEATGVKPQVRPLEGDELFDALIEKLGEEAAELRAAKDSERVEELADVLEVIDALAAHLGISLQEARQTAEIKRAQRGGFEQGSLASNPERRREKLEPPGGGGTR